MAGKRKAPKTAFKPGQSGNPKGRPPRPAERAYLERLKEFANQHDIPGEVLGMIWAQAQGGKQWAIEWWANRLFPEAHTSQKLNEDSGAETGNELLGRLRDFFKPNTN